MGRHALGCAAWVMALPPTRGQFAGVGSLGYPVARGEQLHYTPLLHLFPFSLPPLVGAPPAPRSCSARFFVCWLGFAATALCVGVLRADASIFAVTARVSAVTVAVVGVISRASSVLFSAADERAFASRLQSMDVNDAMVTRPFATSADAMCWLTDPLTNDVVVNCCSADHPSRSSGSPPVRWLTVVTCGSRCCFDVNGGGISAVMQLLTGSASSLTVVRKFFLRRGAHGWVNCKAASELLEVLVAACPAAADGRSANPPRVPRIGAPSPAVQRPRVEPGFSSACSVSSETLRVDAPRRCDDLLSPPPAVRGVPAQPSVDSELVVLSLVCGAGVDTASSHSRVDSEEVVLDLTSDHSADEVIQAAGGWEVRDGRLLRECDAAPSLGRAPGSPHATVIPTPGHQPMANKRRAPASNSAPSPFVHSRRGRVPTLPGGVLPGLVTEAMGSKASDPAQIAHKRYKTMVNGGFVDAGAVQGGTPLGRGGVVLGGARQVFQASTLPTQPQHARAGAAPLPGDGAASNIRGQGSSLTFPAQGGRRCWGGGVRSGLSNPTSSTSALTLAPPRPAVTTVSPFSPSRMELQMREVPVGAPAVAALSSRAQLGAEAPTVPAGPLGLLARVDNWEEVFLRLHARNKSTFITGDPGVGTSTFLRRFSAFLRQHWPAPEAVVVVGPTGSSAKTCEGQTYHSFFGFGHQYLPVHANPADEAAHLLRQKRWGPIGRRLSQVRVLLVDEISMVPAATLDTMRSLRLQCQPRDAAPCVFYAFGDFLQLRPPYGGLAFTSSCWQELFGYEMLELTWVRRQNEKEYISAIQDARFGLCSSRLARLMQERFVAGPAYEEIEKTVLHLVPRHKDVTAHNNKCLSRLAGGHRPDDFLCEDSVEVDPDRDPSVRQPVLARISVETRAAALIECVAPRRVQHCLNAQVMFTSNCKISLGLFHGSIGRIVSYLPTGTPVCRFENHTMPDGVSRGSDGLRDAGAGWIAVECAPVKFKARVLSVAGALAVRLQVPFVLGWAITVHRSQSLTLSEAVLDLCEAFEDGMVHTAASRVADKRRMFVKSFSPTRLLADMAAVRYCMECPRL